LLKADPDLAADTIPQGTYRGTLAIETVSVQALWIVNASEPNDLIYGITKSLFNPTNRAAFDGEGGSAASIRIGNATRDLPAPLHPGAERYFREVNRLQRPFIRSGRS
jgi:TRAP-type uncharacterized transport system substrate-binding protein